MESWLREFFGWLPAGGAYYLLIGMISFLESLVAVGIFVPGSVLIVFAGFLTAHGKGTYPLLVLAATIGAIAGDLISYWMGARLGSILLQRPVFKKRRALVHRAEIFFAAHGGKSVFIGRFVGLLRPFIPFVAGTGRMRPLPFVLYVLFSGILWGLAYPGLGYFFGASWKLVQLWTGRFSVFIALIAALLTLDAVFWKWGAPRLSRGWSRLRSRSEILRDRLLRTRTLTTLRIRYPGGWSFLADRFTLRRGSGLFLTTGFVASSLFAAVFLWVVRAVELEKPLLQLDRHIYALAQSLQHPAADRLFTIFALLGSGPVLLALGGLLLLWLVLENRDFSAVILCVGAGGGHLLFGFLKHLFEYTGPEPLLPFSRTMAHFPGDPAFLAPIFYGLAVYMLLGAAGNWRSRFNLVFTGTFLVLLIGASRIYLGIHWFSELLGAFALAAVWLTVLVTASEMRRRSGGEFPWRAGWQPLRLSRRTRTIILALAALAGAAGILLHLMKFTGADG